MTKNDLIGFTEVFTLPRGSAVTMDFRTDRVRVFVDKKDKVVEAPFIA